LNIDDSLLVIVVALNFFLGMLLPVTLGVVQGLQHFKALGSYQIGAALLKLLFGVLLIWQGYGVFGALGAVVLATILTVIISMGHIQRMVKDTNKEAAGTSFAEVYAFGFSSLLVAFCFTVPANMDVVLVKHFFTSSDAGLYTAATVLAKILIFLPMGISIALFPKVSRNRAMRLSTEPLLYRAFLYVGILSGAGTLLYLLAPRFVINMLFGSTYLESAPLVRWYGVAIFFFSLVVVLMNYHLANHTTRFIYFTVLLTLVEILLIFIIHNTLIQVIHIIIMINIIILLGGLIGVRKHAIYHCASIQ
jgi:O-antigen/teichoic acid export membrane protein